MISRETEEQKDLAAGLGATTVFTSALPALLAATLYLVPFLQKAFLIDDPYFLLMARQILKSPLHPMNFDVCWNIGLKCTKAYVLTPGNTLLGFLLVPTVRSASPELVAHLTQLFLVWLAVLAMASFMLRQGWTRQQAIAGTLLLVVVPPLLPMATTAMPDVLSLAVGLIGMERLMAWADEQKLRQGVTAAIALGLGGLARPHLVMLLPVGAFFLIFCKKSHEPWHKRIRLWWPLVIAGVILMSAILLFRERALLLNPPKAFSGLENVTFNLRSYLLYFSFPLPVAAFWMASRLARGHKLLVLAGVPAAILVGLPFGRADALAALAALVLCDLFYRAIRIRDMMQIFLLLWILIPLPVVYYGHLPIKYLLPCMPAVVLLCLRMSQDVPLQWARVLVVGTIAGSAIYSILILRSDADFANAGRDAMRALVAPQVSAGHTVWVSCDFSSYWYARTAGAEMLGLADRQPKSGDFFVLGIREGSNLSDFPKGTLVQTIHHHYRFGRTMFEGKGLYTNRVGHFLWGFGQSNEDRYELWRID